jgi:hypothetical protein
VPRQKQRQQPVDNVTRKLRDETVNLDFEDAVKSLETELGLWSRRVVQPIVISILALSAGGVFAFFRNGEAKESIFILIPSVVGAACVLSALRADRSRQTAIEHLLTTKRALLAARMPEAEHEIESTVLLRALEVFGNSQRALKWMREVNPALKNDTPLRAIQTDEGRREVLNILGRIEYGVIS